MNEHTVLVISHCFAPNTGGVETHLSDLTDYLRDSNINTHVLTYQPLVTNAHGASREKSGSLTIRRLSWIGFGLFNRFEKYPAIQFIYLFPVLFTASFFTVLMNRRKIDVIHCHGMICAVIGRILKSLFGKRVIVSTHAIYGWLYDFESDALLPRFLRWTLSGVDKVIALAEQARKELVKLGVPEDRTGNYTYWVDQKAFAPMDREAARKQTDLEGDAFTVLFVGRLIKVKGVLDLLDASTLLPNISFVLAGDGPLADIVREHTAAHPNVVYAGRISNKDLNAYYNSADVLCVPSQYEEGFGRIILEALSCGCPVIASEKGGIPEAIDSSVGIFIEPTATGIATAVKALASDKKHLADMRRKCRQYAENKFSAKNAEKIIDYYQLPAEARPSADV